MMYENHNTILLAREDDSRWWEWENSVLHTEHTNLIKFNTLPPRSIHIHTLIRLHKHSHADNNGDVPSINIIQRPQKHL